MASNNCDRIDYLFTGRFRGMIRRRIPSWVPIDLHYYNSKGKPHQGPVTIGKTRYFIVDGATVPLKRGVTTRQLPLPPKRRSEIPSTVSKLRPLANLTKEIPAPNPNAPVVGIVVGVNLGDIAHAVSAVKYNNALYAFDPHGKVRRPIITKVFNNLKKDYGCTVLHVYNGPVIQGQNPVCSMFAATFIVRVLNIIASGQTIALPSVSNSVGFSRWVQQVMGRLNQNLMETVITYGNDTPTRPPRGSTMRKTVRGRITK